MRRSVLRTRVTGKVDFASLGVAKPILRWFTLENNIGERVRVFGYTAFLHDGPWFGYSDLKLAPCSHCGRSGVFGGRLKSHWCPANWDGKALPCGKAHDCKGEPSMSFHGVKSWPVQDWREIV